MDTVDVGLRLPRLAGGVNCVCQAVDVAVGVNEPRIVFGELARVVENEDVE